MSFGWKQKGKMLCAAAVALASGLLVTTSTKADPVEDFYRGKTLRVIVGYAVGGGSPTETLFANQLSLVTKKDCSSAALGTAGYPFGPYLKTGIPANPYNGLTTVQIIADGAAPDEIIPLLNDYADAVISSLHEEGGEWKVVHLHFSVGVPDEEEEDFWYMGQHYQARDESGAVLGRRTYLSDAGFVGNRRSRVKLIERSGNRPSG